VAGAFGGAMARKCSDGNFVADALWKSVAGIFFGLGLKGTILDRSKDFTWVLKNLWNSRRYRVPCNPEIENPSGKRCNIFPFYHG
jgi:hypothetical protein